MTHHHAASITRGATAECWLQLMAETDSVKFNLKAGKRSTSALLEYYMTV